MDGLDPRLAASLLLAAGMLLAPQALIADEIAARELANGDSLARDGKLDQSKTAWTRPLER